MISKTVVLMWTVLTIWAYFRVATTQPDQNDALLLVAAFGFWMVVAVPVSLVGLLFKKR